MLRVAHLTDTHIPQEGELIKELNSREKFTRTLNQLTKENLDLIILTGDLTHPEGDQEAYEWIRDQLEQTGIHYLIVPGNHDDPSMMQEIFNLKDMPPKVILTGAVAMKGESLLFLDSSSARLDIKQKLWFSRELATQPRDCLLFMHHPPCLCDVPFMDVNYPYRTSGLFLSTVKESGKNLTIFCGHYHVEKTVLLEDPAVVVHITPPTLGCLDPNSREYTLKDPRTGWRLIEIEKQKVLSTMCFYLEDS